MTNKNLEAEIDRILNADHGDPFSILGMHKDPAGGTEVVVRTFQPRARRVSVVDSATAKVVAELPEVREEGFFAGPVKGRTTPFRYKLRLLPHGSDEEYDIEDAYRFGPVLGELDIHLLVEGTHLRIFEKLGSHLMTVDGVPGAGFAVWAPNARRVSVVGDFNGWDGRRHPMRCRLECGVWEMFIPHAAAGTPYKYEIKDRFGNLMAQKADPFGQEAEVPPKTASLVPSEQAYGWDDAEWMRTRAHRNDRDAAVSIYEVHLGSWRRKPEEENRFLTYRELADELVPYTKDLGFTHIELMPIHEHPFDGSWGYQPVGLFAPTSRFGSPNDFKYFIDRCHQEGISVLIDWVAGHFPGDPHGLNYFDGTHLYEHADPRKGKHMDWDTLIFNYGRREVSNFLLSNALYWMEEFHIDGLRVDAVASMLYLDYSRKEGEWIPNVFGGRENLEAIDFLKRMNELVYGHHEGVMTVAEESTAWPMVSRPTYLGGLGFGYKWNMGWMNDTLRYMCREPVHRKYHHNLLTFGLLYAFTENFVLPISHDEVVHGKGSLLSKMPGDSWQQFANLRSYLTFMWTMSGKKLLFMGCEFAQGDEWNHNKSLDWHLLEYPFQQGVQNLVRDLNRVYRDNPALHELDCMSEGFQWINCHDSDNSVISFLRIGKDQDDFVVVVCNFTPVPRSGYAFGVPRGGEYDEILNTDADCYAGSGFGNGGRVMAEERSSHGRPFTLNLNVPPLGALILKPIALPVVEIVEPAAEAAPEDTSPVEESVVSESVAEEATPNATEQGSGR
ncbi:1,4-alpha-glucan branching enzyme [uncultured Defluviicoccus sp.]|uniref:1,4-alpha-glucan branching enzyme n=1 Tax=metagenome TaxID=256318 RepID=A0A380TDM5_9ZZZZ|nr:1,4-alpha-glucan branching enzyme [uncultured Defluviicoccus sp.]